MTCKKVREDNKKDKRLELLKLYNVSKDHSSINSSPSSCKGFTRCELCFGQILDKGCACGKHQPYDICQ